LNESDFKNKKKPRLSRVQKFEELGSNLRLKNLQKGFKMLKPRSELLFKSKNQPTLV